MRKLSLIFSIIFIPLLPGYLFAAAKTHTVSLGSVRKAVYMPAESAPAANVSGAVFRIRPLIIDGRVKEWTTGDAHDVTERSFTVRRAVRINDSLPGETVQRWTWQSGAWLLIDRLTGHITLLHLPNYDAIVSEVVWFRDYAAYCGVSNTAKTLYAIVARAGVAKAIVQKEIAHMPADDLNQALCAAAVWERSPIRVTFNPSGHDAMSFEISGTTASVLEEAPDNDE